MAGLATPPRLVRRELDKSRRGAAQAAAMGVKKVKQGFKEAKGYWQPQYDYGQDQLNAFQQWGQDPDAITSDPSYQWRLNQGAEALENSAIAGPQGIYSGNFAKDMTDYAQGAASQEYQNEFARWMQKLLYGEDATQSMGDLAANQGMAVGNMLTGAGQNEFMNKLATAQEVRGTAGAFNNILKSWFPTSGGQPSG